MNEEQYKKDLEESGVELEEEETTPEPEKEPEPEPAPEPEATEEDKDEEPEDEKDAPEVEPDKSEKRKSIYKDLKETRKELREAKELVTDLQEKLTARDEAKTPEDKAEAQDELDKFATEIGADPEAVKRMRDIILKDAKKSIDPDVLKRLEEVDNHNKQLLAEKKFDQDFSKLASFKDLFPTVSGDELDSVKNELKKLSDKPEYKGLDLDYILFKNKDSLSKLVSPKKKGMESRNRTDAGDEIPTEFNPDADITSMTPQERDAWETTYRNAGKSEGLITQGNKKIII